MKKISKLINFPIQIVEAIEKYQSKMGIPTFTGAVLELVRLGLEESKK